MPLLQRLLSETKKRTVFLKVDTKAGFEQQKVTLRKLLSKAKDTSFGKFYDFDIVLNQKEIHKAFAQRVPIGDYSKALPWWSRSRMGEPDVTWPGITKNFAVSSGTSDGASKYIPVTNTMLRSIKRASLRQIVAIAQTNVRKGSIAKKWLMIGGSTQLEYNGMFYSGDLSGITTGQVPILFQRLSKPEPHIRNEKNWQEKIQKITEEAINWDVGLIAGVPAWVKLLIENIIEYYKVENIHQIWPNLAAYVHGGVSLGPYKKSLDTLFGKEVKYFETYLASEGFIAFQSREDNNSGMRMLLRNGIYYEFVRFNEENFTDDGEILPTATAITLDQVEQHVEYALVISTCSGAWRYLIGDVVEFTDVSRCEIKITGRTKHFLSLCGEHLSVDNMTKAIEILANDYHTQFEEFTVCGVPYKGFFAHEWFISCDNPAIIAKAVEVKTKLDMTLKVLNDDYRVERSAALKEIIVHFVPNEVFLEWMRRKGKEGSQNKFPRVLKKEMQLDWKNHLEECGYMV